MDQVKCGNKGRVLREAVRVGGIWRNSVASVLLSFAMSGLWETEVRFGAGLLSVESGRRQVPCALGAVRGFIS